MKNFTSDFMILNLESDLISSNLPVLQEKEAESFIKGERSDCSREYFLNIHSIRPKSKTLRQKIFNKSPNLLLSSPNFFSNRSNITAPKLISKIIKNNLSSNTIPVVHLLSSFSGAAHYQLNKVSGDVILCTYSDPNKNMISSFIDTFIKLRTSTENLTKYILDNFYLCAAVGFAISVKIVDKIFSYKIDSSVITATENLENMTACLEKEKKKFQQFTHSLPDDLKKNHLENPMQVIPLIPVLFKDHRISITDNLVLVVIVAIYDSMNTLKKLLSKTKTGPGINFREALEKNLDKLERFLDCDRNPVTEYPIAHAITKNFDALSILFDLEKNFDALATLLNYNDSSLSEGNLRTAIENNESDELKLLLSYAKKHSKSVYISELCRLTIDLSRQLTQTVAGTGEQPDGLTAQDNPNQPFYQQITPTSRPLPKYGYCSTHG